MRICTALPLIAAVLASAGCLAATLDSDKLQQFRDSTTIAATTVAVYTDGLGDFVLLVARTAESQSVLYSKAMEERQTLDFSDFDLLTYWTSSDPSSPVSVAALDLSPFRNAEFFANEKALVTDPPYNTSYANAGGKCVCAEGWEQWCRQVRNTTNTTSGCADVSCTRYCEIAINYVVSEQLDGLIYQSVSIFPYVTSMFWARGTSDSFSARVWVPPTMSLVSYGVAAGKLTKNTGLLSISEGLKSGQVAWSNRQFELVTNHSIVTVATKCFLYGWYIGDFYVDVSYDALQALFGSLASPNDNTSMAMLINKEGYVVTAEHRMVKLLFGRNDGTVLFDDSLAQTLAGNLTFFVDYWDDNGDNAVFEVNKVRYVAAFYTMKRQPFMYVALELESKYIAHESILMEVLLSTLFPAFFVVLTALFCIICYTKRLKRRVEQLENEVVNIAEDNAVGTPAEGVIHSLLNLRKKRRPLNLLEKDELLRIVGLIGSNKLFQSDYEQRKKDGQISTSLETKSGAPFNAWSFNVLNEFDTPQLDKMALISLRDNGLIGGVPVDVDKLCLYFNQIQEGYKDNPFVQVWFHSADGPLRYHNAFHAMDVLQALTVLLGECKDRMKFTKEELFAAILAATVHDYKHPGVNNTFLTTTFDPLALRYNAVSVLESMHAADSATLLHTDLNFLQDCPKASYSTIISIFTQMVLATDMSRHVEIMSQLTAKIASETFDFTQSADRLLALKCLLKFSDLSNPSREWDACFLWAKRVLEENFAQGDREKQLGLPVSPFMDRATTNLPKVQVTFLTFVALPLVETMCHVVPVVGAQALANIQKNIAKWKEMQADSD
eukprot:m51a1_g10729 putative 3 5 -cyclic nucleotide phosphodiesterase family protein (836) ;mRNA; f:277251-280300